MAPFSSEKLKGATSEIVVIVNFLTLEVFVSKLFVSVLVMDVLTDIFIFAYGIGIDRWVSGMDVKVIWW